MIFPSSKLFAQKEQYHFQVNSGNFGILSAYHCNCVALEGLDGWLCNVIIRYTPGRQAR